MLLQVDITPFQHRDLDPPKTRLAAKQHHQVCVLISLPRRFNELLELGAGPPLLPARATLLRRRTVCASSQFSRLNPLGARRRPRMRHG
jgi:hypothetical protein